jgi:hypothetical protein
VLTKIELLMDIAVAVGGKRGEFRGATKRWSHQIPSYRLGCMLGYLGGKHRVPTGKGVANYFQQVKRAVVAAISSSKGKPASPNAQCIHCKAYFHIYYLLLETIIHY